jgi:hypothetical protein
VNQQTKDELPGAVFMSLLFAGILTVFVSHGKIAWGWSPGIGISTFTLLWLNARC